MNNHIPIFRNGIDQLSALISNDEEKIAKKNLMIQYHQQEIDKCMDEIKEYQNRINAFSEKKTIAENYLKTLK